MKLFKIMTLAAAVLSAGIGFTACSDDDAKTQLTQPSVTAGATSVSSLTFTWDKVEGATQYACSLFDPSETEVDTRVTNTTEATFTGLAPATTYTLKVWAYGAFGGDKTTSPTTVLTATTDAVVKLATPAPTADTSSATIVVSWPAVDNADYYSYSYYIDETLVSGTVETNELRLAGLPKGSYTVDVVAESYSEAFSSSDTGSVSFVRSTLKLWEVEGVYYCAYYQDSWETTMEHYDDGSYVIKNWFNVEGYDLIFSVNDDSSLEILNGGGLDSWGYYNVPTGIDGFDMPIYTTDGFSNFSGNAYSGSLFFYDGWTDSDDCYDSFTWESATGSTVDDLCGSYMVSMTGWEESSSTNWEWATFNYEYDLTITKIDDTTISLNDFYWMGLSLTGTVDFANHTITFPVQSWGYYIFCREDCDDNMAIANPSAVVATFDDNFTITLDGWTSYYESGSFAYVSEASATLTKQY